ncbi:hypothetical protein KKA02_02895 [Patescibacteria group bacterium]|nr:hypothetical protein [Patescibacteria group bacterium]
MVVRLAELVDQANLANGCGGDCPVLVAKKELVLRKVPGGRIVTSVVFCNSAEISWNIAVEGEGARSQTLGTQRVSEVCRQRLAG